MANITPQADGRKSKLYHGNKILKKNKRREGEKKLYKTKKEEGVKKEKIGGDLC